MMVGYLDDVPDEGEARTLHFADAA